MSAVPVKPMLEFITLPELVPGRPRRRRQRVKTPDCPRVKAVAHGCGVLNSQCDIKWVSPQFSRNLSEGFSRRKTSRHKANRDQLVPLEVHTSNAPVAVTQSLGLEEEDGLHITVYPTPLVDVNPHQHTSSLLDVSARGNGIEHAATQAVSSRDSVLGDASPQTVPDPDVPWRAENKCLTRDSDETTVACSVVADGAPVDETYVESVDMNHLTVGVVELSDLVSNMSIESAQEYTSCAVTSVLEYRLPAATSSENRTFKPPSFSTPYHYEFQHCSNFKNDPPSPCHEDPSDHLPNTTLKSVAPLQQPASIAASSGPSMFNLQVTESEDEESILARETPEHLWMTPEIKIIDNSFL